jgi:glycosyltransferase 2 family protein
LTRPGGARDRDEAGAVSALGVTSVGPYGPRGRTALRATAGLVVSAVLIGVLVAGIEPARVGVALARIHPGPVLLILVPVVADLLLRTLRWWILLSRDPRPSFRLVYRALVMGYVANSILPARMGELVRAHVLGAVGGFGRARALGSIAMERWLDLTFAAVLGVISVALAPLTDVAAGRAFAATFGGIAVAGCGALLFISIVPHGRIRAALKRATALAGPTRVGGIARSACAFLEALVDAASAPVVLAGSGLTIVSWLIAAGAFELAAVALGLDVAPTVIVVMVVAANLGAALPSAPAGIGPYELGVVLVGTAGGLDGASALALGIVAHVAVVVPVALAGSWEIARPGRKVDP